MPINKKMNLSEKALSTPELVPTRDGFGKGLLAAGERDERVVGLCADLTESVRMHWFAEKFPKRFFQVGVAEQNLAGVAAGLALEGKIPFASSFGVFSPGRNWDQIRVSICYSKANVKIASSHTGLTVGQDGATHQALEDVAIMRVLPGMTVLVPCDMNETKKATLAAAEHEGPVYLRFGREKTPVVTTDSTPFEIGKVQVFYEGTDVAIIACGILTPMALSVAAEMEKNGTSVCVVNCHTIKPLDQKAIAAIARKCGAVVTAEEHQITGGLGGAVSEFLSQEYPVPIERFGMRDSFGESASASDLLKKYGFTASELKNAVNRVLKKKR